MRMESPGQYSTIRSCDCKVIKEQIFREHAICRIWSSNQDAVERESCFDLQPLNAKLQSETDPMQIANLAVHDRSIENLKTIDREWRPETLNE